jgi:hypothetical protein
LSISDPRSTIHDPRSNYRLPIADPPSDLATSGFWWRSAARRAAAAAAIGYYTAIPGYTFTYTCL